MIELPISTTLDDLEQSTALHCRNDAYLEVHQGNLKEVKLLI